MGPGWWCLGDSEDSCIQKHMKDPELNRQLCDLRLVTNTRGWHFGAAQHHDSRYSGFARDSISAGICQGTSHSGGGEKHYLSLRLYCMDEPIDLADLFTYCSCPRSIRVMCLSLSPHHNSNCILYRDLTCPCCPEADPGTRTSLPKEQCL